MRSISVSCLCDKDRAGIGTPSASLSTQTMDRGKQVALLKTKQPSGCAVSCLFNHWRHFTRCTFQVIRNRDRLLAYDRRRAKIELKRIKHVIQCMCLSVTE